MISAALLTIAFPAATSPLLRPLPPRKTLNPHRSPLASPAPALRPSPRAAVGPISFSTAADGSDLGRSLLDLLLPSPPTWKSSALCNLAIFVLGSPVLAAGLSLPGAAAAFSLGVLTWRAFGPAGFAVVAAYFVVGTASTKLKIREKEALGVAEKRSGRRGPESVIGSSAAGCVCALLSIAGIGGSASTSVWQLGFITCFCSKLSDTVSSEIGKAYGRTTYLVTTFQKVPRGIEGAVSIEGTAAGLIASIILASFSFFLGLVNLSQVVCCVLASQIANLGESLIGATLQDKEGFQWLDNNVVNVINISTGTLLAILMNRFLFKT